MTDQQKDQALQQMLQDAPVQKPTPVQKDVEDQKMLRALAQGTIERVGDFKNRAKEITGSVRIIQLNGRYVLAFSQDFQVDPAPRTLIILSGHPNPLTGEQMYSEATLEVGKLKIVEGAQLYELPTDFRLDKYHSVAIYCQPLKLLLGVAGIR